MNNQYNDSFAQKGYAIKQSSGLRGEMEHRKELSQARTDAMAVSGNPRVAREPLFYLKAKADSGTPIRTAKSRKHR
jgi:hypothetical protein